MRDDEVSDIATRIVGIACAELGVCEAGGPNRGPPIERYAGGREGEPWCAHFVSWVYREAGYPLPGDVQPSILSRNPIALVARMELEASRAHRIVDHPMVGGVVLFTRRGASDAGPGRHCGIVEEVTPTMLRTIEGNTGDAVRRRRYALTSLSRQGFAFISPPSL